MPVVLITGASGLLGRAVVLAFQQQPEWDIVGLGFTRGSSVIRSVDLRNEIEVKRVINEVKPNVIVHSAAERRVENCEADVIMSEALNVHATYVIARAANEIGATFIHISTDYVFDGQHPPYTETAPVCPLNLYGSQKARSESAAIAGHRNPIILRVPVLYGPTKDLSESAVTMMATAVRASEKVQKFDLWQIRVPTLTTDIALTIRNIANHCITGGVVSGIFHYSSREITTRYKLAQLFGEILSLPTSHIGLHEGEPPGAVRPKDCLLSCEKLIATGLAAPHTNFRQALEQILKESSAS